MKKVKVRIAVAVDLRGHWNSCGWSTAKRDSDMMDLAIEPLEEGERRYWLTAELELPEAADAITREAEVTEVKP